MEFNDVIEHTIISLLALLIGGSIGAILGYVCALSARTLQSFSPSLQKWFILLPVRTFIMGALLLAYTPALTYFSLKHFGLGLATGVVDVTIIILLLTLGMSFSVIQDHWHPNTSLTFRLVRMFRTLATASVVITTTMGLFGGGGTGYIFFQSSWLMEYQAYLHGWVSTVSVILVFDLLIGVIQLIFYQNLITEKAG